jgi:hypothetical protein
MDWVTSSDPPETEGGHDPARCLIAVYDDQQPAGRPDAFPVVADASRPRVGTAPAGMTHGEHYTIAIGGHLGVLQHDVAPPVLIEYDLLAVGVGGGSHDS